MVKGNVIDLGRHSISNPVGISFNISSLVPNENMKDMTQDNKTKSTKLKTQVKGVRQREGRFERDFFLRTLK